MSIIDRPYDESYPPSLWETPAVPATGATAGIPGTWTPAGSQRPASPADLAAGIPNAVTASPATPWTTGQYVQTATVGLPGRATWTGTSWVSGAAPVLFVDTMTVAEVEEWVDDHPELADEVLELEQAREHPRVTLIDWLHGFIAHRDDDELEEGDGGDTG